MAYTERSGSPQTDWRDLAACRGKDPRIFFPEVGTAFWAARKICVDCPVRQPCADYALANRIDHGVWGGLSERQRVRGDLRVRPEPTPPAPPAAPPLSVDGFPRHTWTASTYFAPVMSVAKPSGRVATVDEMIAATLGPEEMQP